MNNIPNKAKRKTQFNNGFPTKRGYEQSYFQFGKHNERYANSNQDPMTSYSQLTKKSYNDNSGTDGSYTPILRSERGKEIKESNDRLRMLQELEKSRDRQHQQELEALELRRQQQEIETQNRIKFKKVRLVETHTINSTSAHFIKSRNGRDGQTEMLKPQVLYLYVYICRSLWSQLIILSKKVQRLIQVEYYCNNVQRMK